MIVDKGGGGAVQLRRWAFPRVRGLLSQGSCGLS